MAADPAPVIRFFGYALMAVGALIALSSGACTLYFLTLVLQQGPNLNMIWGPLAFGGPFVVTGVALAALGRVMSRRGSPHERPEDVF